MFKSTLLLFVIVAAMFIKASEGAAASTATVVCTATTMTVSVTRDATLAGTPYSAGYKDDAGCAVTGTAPFVVTYTSLSACDITGSGTYSTTIIVPKLSTGLETVDDEILTVTCDPADVLESSLSDATALTSNTNNNEAGTASKTYGTPTATLTAEMADGTAISGAQALGTGLKLEATVTDDVSGAFDSILVDTCLATSTSSSSDAVNIALTAASGCAEDDTFFGEFTTSGTTSSALFDAFKFANVANVYFHCDITVCPVNDNTCAAPSCSKRKRRDITRITRNADGNVTSHTFSAITKITVRLPDEVYGLGKETGTESNDICMDSMIMIVIGAVIGTLLFIVVTALVFTCIRQLRNPRDKLIAVDGFNHANKAYVH